MDRKNLLKAGRRNSLNVSSRSLNASRILTDSSNYVLENYGTSLPVAVIELISSSGKSGCSVNLSKDGWAWFVSGRQLVIWKFSKSGQGSQATSTTVGRKSTVVASPKAYELTLPPSELAHKADLVTVFASESENVPSCIAVSPEGTVRYWDSVAHESFFVEVNADLQGQECDLLVEAMPLGCLVATTTASILMLTPKMSEGRPSVTCRAFKTPQGLLGSIGRRMSSFIFGSVSSHQSMDARLVKMLCQKRDKHNLEVQVLCNQSLQYWQVSDTERLVYQCDVDKWAREALITHLWSRADASIHHLKVWILDAQINKNDLVMLVAASNPSVSNQIQYAFASVPLQSDSPPSGFSSFCLLKFATSMTDRSESALSDPLAPPHCRFVIVNGIGHLYTDRWILCVSATEPLEEPDRLEVRAPNERFLGAGVYGQKAMFFSSRHGVLILQPSSAGPNDSQSFFDESILEHSQVMSDTQNLDAAQTESASSKLKMAFFNFCRKNVYETQQLLEELFSSPSSKGHPDSLMDRLVVELSERIIDDYPASDPRWTDSVPAGHESTFTTVSLLVLHQIEDKVKAHDLFIAFLRNMSMWSELTSVSGRRGAKSSAFSLTEHAEKLRAALALRGLHTHAASLIDTAIRRVLQEQAVELANDKLTQQDLFYRRVSALNDFYPCLVDVLHETVAASGANPADKVKHIVGVANIVIAMTNAARDYRARNIELLEQCEHNTELLPWIAAPGPRSVRSSIVRLLHLTVDEGVANADDAGVRSGLWGQAYGLADLLLDALKLYADSCEDNLSLHAQVKQDVHTERAGILELFLKGREFDRAAVLAEKYVDFGALLTICDETMSEDRLSAYIDKLGESGFTEFACRWYMQRNQREKLLRLRRAEVSAFLENHPDILWVDQSESEQYLDAARTLISLASAEKELFSRKKTLLSLAKLHLVTEEKLGPDPELVQSESDAVESELTLLMHQEQLPAAVLHAYDLDPDTMRVLTACEMIEMYICDENVLANELDFKKALDLLRYVEDAHERESRRSRIWAKAILRDAWTTFDTDNVLSSVSSTVFFKIVEFSLSTGEDLADVLPDPEEILQEPLLSELAASDVFQFLLKAVYEHVRSLMEVAR